MADRSASLLVRHLHHLADARPAPGLADAELLVCLCHSHYPDAMETLVRRHGPMVLRVARGVLADWADAEDVFQATFLALSRQAASIRKGESLGSWLHGVAYRLALKLRASASRRQRVEARAKPRTAADPLAEMTARELVSLIDDELRRLPEKYRAAVLSCCVEGRTHSEVARELGCPLGTLRSRLDRGREVLRARLLRRGISLSVPLLASALAEGAVPATLRTAVVTGTPSARVVALALTVSRLTWAAPLGMVAGVVLAGIASGAILLYSGAVKSADSPRPATPADAPARAAEVEPLPPGAFARLGTLRFRHRGFYSMAMSHDGTRLATIGGGYVRLFDTATGKELHAYSYLKKEPGPYRCIALAPNGKTVAFDTYTHVVLLDVATGRVVRKLETAGGPGTACSIAFSPDGKTIATARDADRTLWETATGKPVARLNTHGPANSRSPASALAYSRDGAYLAWAQGATVGIRDVKAGKSDYRTIADKLEFRAIALSGDGKLLATAGDDRAVKVWDVTNAKLLRTLAGHAAIPHHLAFSPDGTLLASASTTPGEGSGHELHALRLWDTATGKELAKLGRHAEGVRGVCFSPDGKLLYSAGEMATRTWDVPTRAEVVRDDGHHGWIGALAYSPDGRTLATAGSDMTVRLWDVATRKVRQRLEGCEAVVDSIDFAPDGKRLAAGSRKGRVVVWELPGGKEVARLQACKEGWEARAAFSPDGKLLATISRRGQVGLWDASTLKETRRLADADPRFLRPGAMSLSFAPDGKRLALGMSSEMAIKLGKEKLSDQVHLWDVTQGVEVRRFVGSTVQLFLTSLRFSPDGRLLAAGNWDRSIEVWDVLTGDLRWRTNANETGNYVAFSPGGRMLASTGFDGRVCLWEVATGTERRSWTGHVDQNIAIAFSPDGRTVATGGMDTTVLLWNARAPLAPRPKAETPPDLWAALAGPDGVKAYEAIVTLSATPDATVRLLREKLAPAVKKGANVERLLKDLDSDEFATREKATEALAQLGAAIEPALRSALESNPSPEARRRVERLLAKLRHQPLTAEELRQVRAVEALEYCGTADARQLLEAVARGAEEARLTLEAKAALARLARRAAK